MRAAATVLLVWCAWGAGGCAPTGESTPAAVRVGLLPDQAEQPWREPLLGALQAHSGLAFEVVPVDDYAALVDRFGARDVDLAYFGGYTFVRAHRAHDAQPLVLRDTDLEFRSGFIAAADDPRESLAEFRGAVFTFGSRLSTSGHLMPRWFLENWGFDPEAHFAEVRYSGAHDRTIRAVAAGEAGLGAANLQIVERRLAGPQPADVRVVRVTPPYPDYVWAVQSDMAAARRDALRSAFLGLSPADAEDAAVLEAVGAGGYLPARVSDFAPLFRIVESFDDG